MRVSKILLLMLLFSLISFQSVFADNQRDMRRFDTNRGISLENAVSRAKNHYNGRVISAETEKKNGKGAHRIRILTEDGRVRRLSVDPQTGEYVRPGSRAPVRPRRR